MMRNKELATMRMALSSMGLLAVAGCSAAPAPPAEPAQATAATAIAPLSGPERRILAFGDSLFAGYGVGLDNSFPAQLEAALRKDGVNTRIANAGVSGDTTAAGRQRLAFTLDAQKPAPDLVILGLGGNDVLRGLKPSETRANLEAMLDELGKRKIPVLLMGLRAPPNYGPEYQRAFDAIYTELGKRPGVTLAPFWIEALVGRPELLQADRIHPTIEGIGVLVERAKARVASALPPSAG